MALVQNDSKVYQLMSQGDHDQFIKQNKVAVIGYTVPWCPPCIAMKPAFDLAAKTLSSNDIKFANVSLEDATRGDIGARASVRGTPTVNIYRDGAKKDIVVGNRSYDDLAIHVKAAAF
jgi:thiol-disulfide isomerase/thioredoxin